MKHTRSSDIQHLHKTVTEKWSPHNVGMRQPSMSALYIAATGTVYSAHNHTGQSHLCHAKRFDRHYIAGSRHYSTGTMYSARYHTGDSHLCQAGLTGTIAGNRHYRVCYHHYYCTTVLLLLSFPTGTYSEYVTTTTAAVLLLLPLLRRKRRTERKAACVLWPTDYYDCIIPVTIFSANIYTRYTALLLVPVTITSASSSSSRRALIAHRECKLCFAHLRSPAWHPDQSTHPCGIRFRVRVRVRVGRVRFRRTTKTPRTLISPRSIK